MAKLLLRGASPPAQAAVDGKTTLVFQDHFTTLNTIDTLNTKTSGYNWYINHAFPLYGSADPARTWRTFDPQDAIELTITSEAGAPASSTLTCGLVPTDSKINIISVAPRATSPFYVGNVFGPGGYFRWRMKMASVQTVSCWMMPINVLIGTTQIYVEIDVQELFGSTDNHNHMWYGHETSNPLNIGTDFTELYGASKYTPDDDGNFHTYDVSWKTIAQGAGTGSLKFLMDDVVQKTFTYTTGDPAAVMDTMQYALLLSGSVSRTDLVQVWQ